MTILPLRAPHLAPMRHGFLGRQGGVSQGIYASLNVGLGSADDAANVQENRRRALAAVAPDATLVSVHQVHSPTCLVVEAPIPLDQRPPADAMVTKTPGLALSILTADCAPILFADSVAGVIGAAHAGWKGALGGVIAATLSAMEGLGAKRDQIAAAIGPCIAKASYEVDAGFYRRFVEENAENDRFFSAGQAGHHYFDLEGFCAAQLARAGVRQIDMLGTDTYAHPERYFSYRRTTHKKEPDYGRQLSLIALP